MASFRILGAESASRQVALCVVWWSDTGGERRPFLSFARFLKTLRRRVRLDPSPGGPMRSEWPTCCGRGDDSGSAWPADPWCSWGRTVLGRCSVYSWHGGDLISSGLRKMVVLWW